MSVLVVIAAVPLQAGDDPERVADEVLAAPRRWWQRARRAHAGQASYVVADVSESLVPHAHRVAASAVRRQLA